jgi:outer membrane lipoprotein-sorting protein
MRHIPSWRLLVSALVLYLCFLPAASSAQEGAARAEELFRGLEDKLLRGTAWVVRAQTTSEGAFVSNLSGAVGLRQGNVARIELNGTFGDKSINAFLISDGDMLLYGEAAAGSFEEGVPWALNEAIVIGLTRMGLLHNFARLTAGSPPDRMMGGVRDWVEVSDFRLGEPESGDAPATITISFSITVAGQPAGQATLWFDEETGLPLRREQTVEFETGTMMVIEVYEFEDLPAQP